MNHRHKPGRQRAWNILYRDGLPLFVSEQLNRQFQGLRWIVQDQDGNVISPGWAGHIEGSARSNRVGLSAWNQCLRDSAEREDGKMLDSPRLNHLIEDQQRVCGLCR